MKVSVIVPAYNEERTIELALNSLLDQTASDYEVIVVNDASTDKTAGLLKKFSKNKQVKVINKEKNEGRPRGLNTGLSKATGQIIATTDGDSVAPKDWIARIQSDFSDKMVVGVGGSFEALNKRSLWANANCLKDLVFNELLKKFFTPNMLPGANSAVLASELRAIGGYPVQKWSADFSLSESVRKRGRVVNDPKLVIKTYYPEKFIGSLRRKFYWGVGGVNLMRQGGNRKRFYLRPAYYTTLIALLLTSAMSYAQIPAFSLVHLLTLLWVAPFTLGIFLLAKFYIFRTKKYDYLKVLPFMLAYPLLLELAYYTGLLYGLFGGGVGNWKDE